MNPISKLFRGWVVEIGSITTYFRCPCGQEYGLLCSEMNDSMDQVPNFMDEIIGHATICTP